MPNPLDDAKVYTLDDLKSWEKLRPGLPPSLAVLGHPVAHSVSPQMQNAALAYLVAEGHTQLKDWRYFKFDIEPEELPEALRLLSQKNFKGTNVTVPHKLAVEEALGQENIDISEDEGRDISEIIINATLAVNTVVFGLDKVRAFNTDDYGMTQAIKQDFSSFNWSTKTIVIFGLGGVALQAAHECVRQGCKFLWIGGRNEQKLLQAFEKVLSYAQQTTGIANLTKTQVDRFSLSNLPTKNWPEDVVVINATTLGMKSDDPLPFDVSLLGKDAFVFDMVYNHQRPTKLVKAAHEHGLKATDGLSMLVWQGAKSLTIWIKAHEGIDIEPEAITPVMMAEASKVLGRT
jgi:shikimate dehydrogenase